MTFPNGTRVGASNLALCGLFVTISVGCGDSSSGSGGAGSSTTTNVSSGSTSTSSSTSSSGSSTGTGSAAPQAPVLQSAEPLSGGLHVMWMNVTTDCDKIELDRKKDAGSYATAYTLSGTAMSQHDAQATAPGMYCYKARCVRGGIKSPDSNEKCGTP